MNKRYGMWIEVEDCDECPRLGGGVMRTPDCPYYRDGQLPNCPYRKPPPTVNELAEKMFAYKIKDYTEKEKYIVERMMEGKDAIYFYRDSFKDLAKWILEELFDEWTKDE